jgi:hypothetical protein
MTEDQPENVSLTFDPGPTEAVQVNLDAKALARQRRMARLAEAKAYESLGQRLLKFKAKKFGAVGEYIVTKLGVKKVGHGTIISASENADQYIDRCDALIGELMAKDPPCDPEVIVALMQLIRDFNRQLLDSGEAHLKIDRQPSVAPEQNQLSIPFPQGTPMVIAMGQQQQPAQPAIEAGEP